MSATKKPRADSKLKILPVERQAEIFDYCGEHTLTETVTWLRDDGLKTSKSAVGEFWSWYGLQQEMRQNESTVMDLLEELRGQGAKQEELDVAGNLFFSALAIRNKDSLAWKRTKDAQTRQELARLSRLKLERETCELFLKWRNDEKTNRIAEQNIPNEEKIKLMRKHWFKDVDELEKSGTVKLPD